jgi:hypothetical protein
MPVDDWPDSELPLWLELLERSELDEPVLEPERFASLLSLLASDEF